MIDFFKSFLVEKKHIVSMLRKLIKIWLQWQIMRIDSKKRQYSNEASKIIIISCDPWTLVGSKGDEAMISAVVSMLSNGSNKKIKFGITTATEQADNSARSMGFEPLRIWSEDINLKSMVDTIIRYDPDLLFLLGADVMDGYYSPATSAKLLAISDIVSRKGVKTTILGFSFNEKPSPYLKTFFNGMDERILINIRDPLSYARFKNFSKSKVKLVADAAFMLKPEFNSKSVKDISHWVELKKANKRKVIAFNLHPMLIKNPTESQRNKLVSSAAEVLIKIVKTYNVSILLLSHDYRGNDSDDTCLAEIYKKIKSDLNGEINYPTEKMKASELKAITGYMDGVVTGRMHLAIAALGMRVPVAALTYQDKFQGLFLHYDINNKYLISPNDLISPDKFFIFIKEFISELDLIKDKIDLFHDKVDKLSRKNLDQVLSN